MKKLTLLAIAAISLMLTSCNEAFWAGMAQGAQQYAMGMNPYGYNPYMAYTPVAPVVPVYTPTVTSTTSTTSNPINKDLKTESNGFQWYKVTQGDKVGAEDNNHSTLIPLSRGYDRIYFMPKDGHKGYFSVYKNGKAGACDATGKEVLPTAYESVFYYSSDGFNYKNSSGGYVVAGWELDSNGRAIKAQVKSTLIENFVYYSYVLIENGELSKMINKVDGVKFDFASTTGKILVSIIKDGAPIETMTITPSESSLTTNSDQVKVNFTEGGISKAVALMKGLSGTNVNKAVVLYDNLSAQNYKLFGEMGLDNKMAVLVDFVSQYNGSDFDGQYNRVKTELERYSWNRRN